MYGSVGAGGAKEEDFDAESALLRISKKETPFEKIQSRQVCGRIRNTADLIRIINCKCVGSTFMLVLFSALLFSFLRFLFTGRAITEAEYDFIIVGGGPAGVVLTRRLVDMGASVLLLEAGGGTQAELLGEDSFGGPITRFDIPMLWPAASRFPEFSWNDFNWPEVLVAKGLGGCGIHNAMLYLRSLPQDLVAWGVEGWDWSTVLNAYKRVERYAVKTAHPSSSPSKATLLSTDDGAQRKDKEDGQVKGVKGVRVTTHD